MSMPSPIPLDDFERAIQADPEVLGIRTFGVSPSESSAGRSAW